MEEIVDPLNFSSAGDGGKKQIVHGTVGAAVREDGLAGYHPCPACLLKSLEETLEKQKERKKFIEMLLAGLKVRKDARLKRHKELLEKLDEGTERLLAKSKVREDASLKLKKVSGGIEGPGRCELDLLL